MATEADALNSAQELAAGQAPWQPLAAYPQGSGQARDLQAMPAGGIPMWQFAQQPMQPGPPSSGQKVQQRVITISGALALYVIVGSILVYIVDIVTIDALFEPFHEAMHMHSHNLALLSALKSLPSLFFSIGVGLLVPLCGYFGIKQRQSSLLCCFTCWNACSIVSGLCMFVAALAIIAGTAPLALMAEDWMARCDPYQCMPQGNRTSQSHVVDCLATGVWPATYARKFPEDPSLPEDCLKVWLECGGGGGGEDFDDMDSRQPEEGFRGGPGTWDPMQVPAVRPMQMPAVGPWDQYHHVERRLFSPGHGHEHHGPHFKAGARFGRRGKPMTMPPPKMPKDVLGTCTPLEEPIQNFHLASQAVPELVPKFEGLMLAKALIVFPAIIISCLGCWWGKNAHEHVQQYPVQFAYPNQVMMQPALGTVVATSGPRETTMEQPLMFQPPSQFSS